MNPLRTTFLATFLGLIASAPAAVMNITGITTDGSAPNNLISITTASETLSTLVYSDSSHTGTNRYWHSTLSTDPLSGTAALDDGSPYTGVLNPNRATTTYTFDFAPRDQDTMFLIGRGNDWPSSIVATDSAGTDLPLTLNLTSGSQFFPVGSNDWARNNGTNFSNGLGGWTFALEDFTGTGDIADVRGIRYERDNNNFDPTLIGIAIPEPSRALLLLVGALGLGVIRRR